ncbi:MAG: hypothetical protein KKC79_08140 [Gammaproteobacteria bacterium]|nr:hypothetical protein [Gammaproteobacteria bacterium]MBU1441487.1 hypothetical protein [Gammaproteobacteria bacterium]MBU2288550.1 hypothetical protein [Gammaproteobacteria bacterium]MBU2408605.1 hypothetical protein [Gammaproteobacteria bacterium]
MNKSAMLRFGACLLSLMTTVTSAGPVVIAAEAVDRAYVAAMRASGERRAESAAAQAGSKASIERLAAVHGDRVLDVVGHSGIEFLEAAGRYGDEFVQMALSASPSARRMLAINPGELMPLAREFGDAALEAEAKAPGLGRRMFEVFGKDEGARLAVEVPASDLPRLIAYGEKGTDVAARSALVVAYRKEGASLFKRIPPGRVLESGLTAAVLVRAVGSLSVYRAVADFIREHPFLFMLAVVLSAGACMFAWRLCNKISLAGLRGP